MIETFACATFYLISELKLGQLIELFSVAPGRKHVFIVVGRKGETPGTARNGEMMPS
jgi:hypothetical protein